MTTVVLHSSYDATSRAFVAAIPPTEDVEVLDWYKGGLERAAQLGIIGGVSAFPSVVIPVPEHVLPADFSTRGEPARTVPAHTEILRLPLDWAEVQLEQAEWASVATGMQAGKAAALADAAYLSMVRREAHTSRYRAKIMLLAAVAPNDTEHTALVAAVGLTPRLTNAEKAALKAQARAEAIRTGFQPATVNALLDR